MYFHRTFNLYKADIKKTPLLINKTLSNKKTSDLSQSFRIGNKLTSDLIEIANERCFFSGGGEESARLLVVFFSELVF